MITTLFPTLYQPCVAQSVLAKLLHASRQSVVEAKAVSTSSSTTNEALNVFIRSLAQLENFKLTRRKLVHGCRVVYRGTLECGGRAG